MIKIDVLKDGIDKTIDILRENGMDVKLDAINRASISMRLGEGGMLTLKFSKVYYLVNNRFGQLEFIVSTPDIEHIMENYEKLEKQYEEDLDVWKQTTRSLLDKRKDNVRLRRQLAENKKLIEELSKPKPSEICTPMWCAHRCTEAEEVAEEVVPLPSEAPELVVSLTTSTGQDGIRHLELSSRLKLPEYAMERGCSLGSFYVDKLSEYEAAKSYLDMIIYPSKWNYLGDKQYMKTKGWFLVWQSHLQDMQELHQQGWKISVYVNSGTKLVTSDLPSIPEGNFVLNEPIEEFTPPEEVLPDPEPSTQEQEMMREKAREIVPVYVRLRIKLVNRMKVQALELVEGIYRDVLDAGQEIVGDIPFNMDIHTVVKDLNTRNCLMPRTGPGTPISIFPNFTSHVQEMYRDGRVVELIIGVPTELSTQDEAALADLRFKLED